MPSILELETTIDNSAELDAVARYWFSKNPNVLPNDENARILVKHIAVNLNGVYSVGNIQKAYEANKDNIGHKGTTVVEKIVQVEKPKTEAQLAEEKRRQKDVAGFGRRKTEFDRLDEKAELARDKRTAEQRQKDAEDAELQQAAEVECRRQIQFYTAMHATGRIDHAKTQRNRKMLSEFRVWKDAAKTVVDWPGTLFYIKEAISKM
jgi:hypothetical protein